MFGNTPTGLNKLNWKVQTRLIAIVVWLVGAFLLHANIGSLLIRELGEDCIKVSELQAGHLFIEMLGQNVYAYWVAVMVSEEQGFDWQMTSSSHRRGDQWRSQDSPDGLQQEE